MGGKYEIRYYDSNEELHGYTTLYTNSWLDFIKTRITKKVIYYKVYNK